MPASATPRSPTDFDVSASSGPSAGVLSALVAGVLGVTLLLALFPVSVPRAYLAAGWLLISLPVATAAWRWLRTKDWQHLQALRGKTGGLETLIQLVEVRLETWAPVGSGVVPTVAPSG